MSREDFNTGDVVFSSRPEMKGEGWTVLRRNAKSLSVVRDGYIFSLPYAEVTHRTEA